MKSTLASQAHLTLLALLACLATLSSSAQTPTPSSWDTPATQLASQIASILGPGQAQLELTNRSTIPTPELPTIRRAIEDALRAHNIKPGNAESANTLHITLSENIAERLWIAQILEGSQTQTTIVRLDKPTTTGPATAGAISTIRLERKLLWLSSDLPASGLPSTNPSQILAALEWNSALILLSNQNISLFKRSASGWIEAVRQPLPHPADARPMPREPRGILLIDSSTSMLTVYLPGERCTSNMLNFAFTSTTDQVIHCESSDDPWPIPANPESSPTAGPASNPASSPAISSASGQKAFYNTARNYFTGVLSPETSVELPPFYTALPVVASGTPSLLLATVDGKPRLATSSGIQPLTGARDWGSDLATLTTSCGTTAILASNSGEAREDALRAYDLHGSEAVAVSEPLPLKGSITALNQPGNSPPASSSPASPSANTSILAILRTVSSTGEPIYEVDRVSALCQ